MLEGSTFTRQGTLFHFFRWPNQCSPLHCKNPFMRFNFSLVLSYSPEILFSSLTLDIHLIQQDVLHMQNIICLFLLRTNLLWLQSHYISEITSSNPDPCYNTVNSTPSSYCCLTKIAKLFSLPQCLFADLHMFNTTASFLQPTPIKLTEDGITAYTLSKSRTKKRALTFPVF